LDQLKVSDVALMFEQIEEFNDTIAERRTDPDPQVRQSVKFRRPVSLATMHRIRATLRHALNMAMRQDRLIDFNPAAVVELPAATRPKGLVWTEERVARWRADHAANRAAEDERRAGRSVDVIQVYLSTARPSPVMVWTPEQTSAFLAYARRHRLYALYRLIALRGLRRGEAVGLRWQEVSFTSGTIAVNWQITQLGWTPVQGKPKTDASDRVIAALDAETLAILKEHRRRQAKERLKAGEDWTDSGFVFTDEYGRPLHPQHVTDQFYWMCYEADLPPLRLHDLRHGAASLMLAAGVEVKVVQETLGHVSSTFTRDTYTSVYPEVARAAAESTAALLASPSSTMPSPSGPSSHHSDKSEASPSRRKTSAQSRARLAIVPDV
jgi:integrase